MSKKIKEFGKKLNTKVAIATGTMLMALPVLAEETSSTTTMIDTSKIDFAPLLTTIAAVIAVALTPMITVAAGKKGLSFIKSIMSKIG